MLGVVVDVDLALGRLWAEFAVMPGQVPEVGFDEQFCFGGRASSFSLHGPGCDNSVS
jgi:hypothetical protein